MVWKLLKWVLALIFLGSLFGAKAGLIEGLSSFNNGDHQQALGELRPLAEQGVPLAQLALAVMHHDGRGVAKDPSEGLKWYLKAAEQGLAQAQVAAGNAYFLGIGAPADPAEAAKWYARAANQGWPQGLFSLASMHSVGLGVAKDLVAAYRWCLLSAAASPEGAQRQRAETRCDRLTPQLSQGEIAARVKVVAA